MFGGNKAFHARKLLPWNEAAPEISEIPPR